MENRKINAETNSHGDKLSTRTNAFHQLFHQRQQPQNFQVGLEIVDAILNNFGNGNQLLMSALKRTYAKKTHVGLASSMMRVDLPRNQATSLNRFLLANGNSAKERKFTNGARASQHHRNKLNSW